MADPNIEGLGFLIIIAAALCAIAKVIQRGTAKAKAGVVVIILILPFLYLFGLPLIKGGEIPSGAGNISSALIIGVIASVIAGIILKSIKK